MVMDRWVVVRHLCLKFNTIASPLNPPLRAGKDSPVSLYWGWVVERGQVNLSKQGKWCDSVWWVYLYLQYTLHSVWFMYLSYKWQDMIKILGVEIPSYAGQWARLGAYR